MSADRVVTLSDISTKAVVKAVTDDVVAAVTKQQQVDFLEQFKQFARQEAELAKAREELLRKDQEIAGLRQHIGTLNGFIANMSNPGAGVFNPYSNGGPAMTTQSLPTFPERFAASAPVPVMPPLPLVLTDNGSNPTA